MRPGVLRVENNFTKTFEVVDYNLGMTLDSGQAFRWKQKDGWWVGVVGQRWVRLRNDEFSIVGESADPACNWDWLETYLQLQVDIREVVRSFPDDEPMRAATTACRGLRLLRQDPWECLASFILSSTKQIVQIRQIVGLLTERFGEPLAVLPGHGPSYSFPEAKTLARATEADLRACKMGFRAPYLLESARMIADGQFEPERIRRLDLEPAREQLLRLPGVGRKIADCVLLFAYGFQQAFPVDVWVTRGLRQLYFRGRKTKMKKLQRFSAEHFGARAGYAQQYLFHYMRTTGVKRKT